jgi:hypothetical protein
MNVRSDVCMRAIPDDWTHAFLQQIFRLALSAYFCVAKYGLNLSPVFSDGQLRRSCFIAIG